MGINVNGLRFLLYAKEFGVDFTKTAMIGRQGIRLSFEQFSRVIKTEYKHTIERKALEVIYNEKYCDKLLEYLGAKVVHSFDYSDYQGATYTHDFNTAIPENFFAQYTAVIEAGTLEHIFNFPNAIRNCMQMLKVGGHYLGSSPTNNYMGHGFYQFSPELFYRVFSRENGFRVEHMIMHEGRETGEWFNVPDPESVSCRVGIMNARRLLLMIIAARLADCPIFSEPPQQSNYVSRKWKGKGPLREGPITKYGQAALKQQNYSTLSGRIKSVFKRRRIPSFFTPFEPSGKKDRSGLD